MSSRSKVRMLRLAGPDPYKRTRVPLSEEVTLPEYLAKSNLAHIGMSH